MSYLLIKEDFPTDASNVKIINKLNYKYKYFTYLLNYQFL